MIDITDLHKSYKMGNNSLHVLKGIDFHVKEGELVSIMGSSGSGPSGAIAIYTKKQNENSKTKALLGPINPADYQHYEGRSVNHHGFPRFRNASFESTYPFGIVNLSDKTMPVEVKLVGYNPFIPADADASGIPMAILKYEVKNTSNEDIEVSISGNLRNFIGKDGSKHKSDWKGDFIPIGEKNNINEYKSTGKLQGIYMYSEGVDKDDAAWGTFAISTLNNKEDKITYRTSSTKNDWYNATLNFWDDFSEDGLLVEKDKVMAEATDRANRARNVLKQQEQSAG